MPRSKPPQQMNPPPPSKPNSHDDLQLLQRAASAGRAGAWQRDLTTGKVSWTPSLEALIGLNPLQFDGTEATLALLVHPDDRAAVSRLFADAIRSSETQQAEVRALQSHQQTEWLRLEVEVIHEANDQTRLVGTAVSIDARKTVELAHQESEDRFKKLFASSPLSATLVALDSGEVRDTNAAFESLTGYSREEAVGRTTVELGLWPSAEDRRAVMKAVNEVGALRDCIVHLRSRNGEERTGRLNAEHVLVGGIPHVVTLFEDITLRERAEAAMRDSEQRLRLALRAASAGVWQTDPQTGEVVWSDEFRELYGYDEATTPGRDAWAAHLHPDDRERMVKDLRTRLKEGSNEYRREFRILHPTRGLRWILALGHIERNDQGRANMRGISIDITRIKEVEQELREADDRKNEFLAVLSHELRNPLAPLRNGIEILRRTQGNGEVAERARVMMARQLDQMVRLIDDLLEVSRISRGKIQLKRSSVDLAATLQHALEVSKPLIDAAGHALTIDIPPGPLLVDADATRLAQVFGNLLNNAAKYTNPGGHIRLTVEKSDTRVSISVRDNGIGIRPELLPKIFEMFAQLDNSLQRTQGGLGIGLSVAKRLVEMHGGSLEAHSEGPGYGCEFVVRLPLQTSAPRRAELSAAGQPLERDERIWRILVADDNRDAASSLAVVLQMLGHEVQVAHDGTEALSVAETFEPEVVILDIGMPRLDGYQVCKALREGPRGRDVLIIALTGWGQSEDKLRSQEAGFDHHLVKPADVESLRQLLRRRAS